MTEQERFFSKVKVTDTCHLWTGYIKEEGYGQFRPDGGRTGKLKLVHRIAWEIANGPIPEGMCVCHHCDVRNCVNPAHLFLGTHLDNTIDCILKGRAARKLTREIVEQIRSEPSSITHYYVAKKFGVDQGLVSRIRRMKAWKIMPLFKPKDQIY